MSKPEKPTPWKMRTVRGPVTTGEDTKLWTVLRPERGIFQSIPYMNGLINGGGLGLAALVGHDLHLRVTNRPYPVETWARALAENTPDPLPTFSDHLLAEQRRVKDQRLGDKIAYLGVGLTSKNHGRTAEVEKVLRAAAHYGLGGRAATSAEVEYLNHRSICLGAPAPPTMPPAMWSWDEDDMATFSEEARWDPPEPFGLTTKITCQVGSRLYTRHVSVLALARQEDTAIPEKMDPWLQHGDAVGFPFEASIHARVLTVNKFKAMMTDTMRRILAQFQHYEEDAGEAAPDELSEKQRRARRILNELKANDPLNTRCAYWAHLAVAGKTEKEALSRAGELSDWYESKGFTFDYKIGGQYDRARAFVPGVKLANAGYRRIAKVTTLAAAGGQFTDMVGDREGPNIAFTARGARRAVCWDTHRSMEVGEGEGTAVVLGPPGVGKSFLGQIITYKAVMRRIYTVALDPAGRMLDVVNMPEIGQWSRAVNLMNADPGTLNPYSLLRDPLPTHHLVQFQQGMTDDDWRQACKDEWDRAVELTRARRATLMKDTLMGLLRAPDDRTDNVLEYAVGKVPETRQSSGLDVLEALRGYDGESKDFAVGLANKLTRLARLPQGALIFPRSADDWRRRLAHEDDDIVFHLFMMRGNTLPRNKPEALWNESDRMAVTALNLAGHFCTEHVIQRPRDERKLALFDEVHFLAAFPAGEAMMDAFSREHARKDLTRVVYLTHKPSDVMRLSEFIDTTFISGLSSPDAVKDALSLQGIDRGVGFERIYEKLSARERGSDEHLGYRDWIMTDFEGGKGHIRVQATAHEMRYMNSTATGRDTPGPQPVPPADWDDDLVNLVKV